jgi:hypothetical protein
MAHGLFLATGSNPVVMEGQNIAITNGYPDATAIENTLADTTGFTVALSAGDTTATFTKTGATGTCEVVYVEPAAANTPPAISVDTSGC